MEAERAAFADGRALLQRWQTAVRAIDAENAVLAAAVADLELKTAGAVKDAELARSTAAALGAAVETQRRILAQRLADRTPPAVSPGRSRSGPHRRPEPPAPPLEGLQAEPQRTTRVSMKGHGAASWSALASPERSPPRSPRVVGVSYAAQHQRRLQKGAPVVTRRIEL